MAHSLSQTATLTCPQCGYTFSTEIWLIVDGDERPDLLARAAQSDLHRLPCPQCGNNGTLDTPLLILRRHEPQGVLIFSPAENTTREQDQEHLNGLMQVLKASLGVEWQEEWVKSLQIAPWALLPLVLGNAGPLGQTLIDCLQARSAEEHRAFLLAHPELLSDAGLNLLERLVELDQRSEVSERLRFFLQVHRHAHEVGVEVAFAEMQEAEDGLSHRFQRIIVLQEQAANQPALWQDVLNGWQGLIGEAEQRGEELLAANARGNLANTCLRLYEVTGNPAWADQAEKLFQTINQFFAREKYPQAWGIVQHSLGTLFLDRYERSGDEGQAYLAEQHYQDALQVRTRDAAPSQWAMTQHSLGTLFLDRYERSGDEGQACLAEQHYQNALQVRTRDAAPSDWAMTQHSLGNLFFRRYERSDDESQACLAEQHYQNALLEYTRDAAPFDWAMTQHSLGNLFFRRYELSNDEGQARLAEQHYQNALLEYTRDVTPSRWAMAQHSLGNLFLRRYERSGDETQARQAEQHYQNALLEYTREATPSDWAMIQHSLGNLFLRRYERSGDDAHALLATQHYQEVRQLAQDIPLPSVFPFRACAVLARLNFRRGNWQEVLKFSQEAQEHLEELLTLQSEQSGSESWLSEAQGLPAQTAWALLQEASPNFHQIVETLEGGRGQLLREALERQRADIERLPSLGYEDLHVRWKNALANEQYLQRGRGLQWFEQMQAIKTEIKDLAAEIRDQVGKEHPEFRYFLQSLPFDEIQRQAKEAPLVYLASTPRGGFAMIVREQCEPQVVNLPRLTETALRERVGKYLGTYRQRLGWQDELKAMLEWLGEAVMMPLLEALQGETRAVLIPGGWLGLLPLHAACLPQGGYALDHITFAYVPSAQALYHARRRLNDEEEHLLAVENPRGDLTPWDVRVALRYFPHNHTYLLGKQATREAVIEALPRASVLHFSTHGNAGWRNSRQARVWLAGEEILSLTDLYDLRLSQAMVAVLSACETALPGVKAIDEVLSLPAGWMLAGVPRVVGSLWSVDDLSTAMLMARFYDLWRGEGKPVAEALRQAQIWLRDTPLEDMLRYWREYPDRQVERAFRGYLTQKSNSLNLRHPYFWAGFACVGLL